MQRRVDLGVGSLRDFLLVNRRAIGGICILITVTVLIVMALRQIRLELAEMTLSIAHG